MRTVPRVDGFGVCTGGGELSIPLLHTLDLLQLLNFFNLGKSGVKTSDNCALDVGLEAILCRSKMDNLISS